MEFVSRIVQFDVPNRHGNVYPRNLPPDFSKMSRKITNSDGDEIGAILDIAADEDGIYCVIRLDDSVVEPFRGGRVPFSIHCMSNTDGLYAEEMWVVTDGRLQEE